MRAHLGNEVPRSRFPSEDGDVRVALLPLGGGHSLEGEVSMDDRVDVHLLSLVLVQPTKKKKGKKDVSASSERGRKKEERRVEKRTS